MNFVERWFVNRAMKQILVGRERRAFQPEKGRFMASDMDAVIARTWQHYDGLSSSAPKFKKHGNKRLMRNGVFSLALYRSLCQTVEDKEYATKLAGDVLWKGYEMSMKLPAALARLVHRDRKKQMDYLCGMGVKYRFSPPAYEVNTRFENNTFFMDFTRCPICDFFRDQGEEELEFFRNTWCKMDWAVIEVMVKGPVRYERQHTLSSGDDICDMRWIVVDDG